jgi:hypothetical protein
MDNANPKLGNCSQPIYPYFRTKAQIINPSPNFLTYALWGGVSRQILQYSAYLLHLFLRYSFGVFPEMVLLF